MHLDTKFVDNTKDCEEAEIAIAEMFGHGDEYRRISKRIAEIKKLKSHQKILKELESLKVPPWYYEIRKPLIELYSKAYVRGLNTSDNKI